jgi:rod shape-determining protein MreD
MRQKATGNWVIWTSFFVALCLSALPLAERLQAMRPEWILLVLIYWVMALPHRVGVISAWILGLLMDALHGYTLGQSGIVFVVIAFFTTHLYQRLRLYAWWQQAFVVFLLVGFGQVVKYLLQSIMGGFTPDSYLYLLPAVASALLWPAVFFVLRGLRRSFDVA